MAKKVELKGILKDTGNIDFVGNNNTPKQVIVVFVPGYRDEFGEQKNKDEYWQIDVIGQRVERYNINEAWLNKKVELSIYISGNQFERKDGSGFGYSYNDNLAEIKQVVPVSSGQNTAPVDANAAPGQDDDLPF